MELKVRDVCKMPEKKVKQHYDDFENGCETGRNMAIDEISNLPVSVPKPHACKCNHEGAFTARDLGDGLIQCPGCGGIIVSQLVPLDIKYKVELIKKCRSMILDDNPEVNKLSLLRPIKYFMDYVYDKFGHSPAASLPSVHDIYETIIEHGKTCSPGDLSWELKLAEAIHNKLGGREK